MSGVRQADIDVVERRRLTSEEKEEPTRLRREYRRAREDVEIPKCLMAFLAEETR